MEKIYVVQFDYLTSKGKKKQAYLMDFNMNISLGITGDINFATTFEDSLKLDLIFNCIKSGIKIILMMLLAHIN